jgi:dethiobiotin synthetase
MNYFVTGIDTDSGKTLASAILCEALQADYWKPVQAGLPRDTDAVASLLTNTKTKTHTEAYLLNTPASPHAAAKIDGVVIDLDKIKLPVADCLIIEGAGGCLVPLNDADFVIDLARQWSCEVILVADLYLGSINHTLLTVNELKRRNMQVKGIIFNGDSNPESERIILRHSGFTKLLHIQREKELSKLVVHQYAQELLTNWK